MILKSNYLNRQQSQLVDRIAINDFEMASLVLMENAAIGATAHLQARNPDRDPVLVFAGAGNNGGDGLAMARQLSIRGIPVAVLWFADPQRATTDCLANWSILEHTTIPRRIIDPGQPVSPSQQASPDWAALLSAGVSQLSQQLGIEKFAWAVDALLGTGAKGAARFPIDQIIRFINKGQWKTVAVDLPSGLDCDEGLTSGEVIKAEATCTFVSQKKSFQLPAVAEVLGSVEVVSIGCPNEVLQQVLGEKNEQPGNGLER